MTHRVCNARYPVIRPLRRPHNFLYNDRGPHLVLFSAAESRIGNRLQTPSTANALHLRGGPSTVAAGGDGAAVQATVETGQGAVVAPVEELLPDRIFGASKIA